MGKIVTIIRIVGDGEESRFEGAGELRHKESDRLHGLGRHAGFCRRLWAPWTP
jgi:5-enolpyruvylshikimate-3-phosphate synthase